VREAMCCSKARMESERVKKETEINIQENRRERARTLQGLILLNEILRIESEISVAFCIGSCKRGISKILFRVHSITSASRDRGLQLCTTLRERMRSLIRSSSISPTVSSSFTTSRKSLIVKSNDEDSSQIVS
jgi:hypothetical protein